MLRFLEFLEYRHMEVIGLLPLLTDHLYPQEITLVLIAFTGWVELRAIVRPEVLSNEKSQ
jgi:ABC-type microcin C transport system permease subunit YejE